MSEKQIGNLNGPWSILLRFALALFPPMVMAGVGFSVWVVGQINDGRLFQERTNANRFTSSDWLTARREIDSTFNLQDRRIYALEERTNTMFITTSRIAEIAAENKAMLLKITEKLTTKTP